MVERDSPAENANQRLNELWLEAGAVVIVPCARRRKAEKVKYFMGTWHLAVWCADHAASLQVLAEKYPEAKVVGNAKTFNMIPQFFTFDLEAVSYTHLQQNITELVEENTVLPEYI